jgi:predicted DNA-binding transcriptional regulator YafY
MSTRKIIEILQRMDQMIRMQSTGGPEDFASRLGVSKRSLYYYLRLLKELGAPIRYSSWHDSYEYFEDGKFSLEYIKKQSA